MIPALLTITLTVAAVPAAAATVTLDVKDADVRVVLKSMQQQCGIKNLFIDPEVKGESTILFREVPCKTAFKVVFRQHGLTGQVTRNLTTVETRKD
jgi:type II secretory pathway component GspD/PulD (secretin)